MFSNLLDPQEQIDAYNAATTYYHTIQRKNRKQLRKIEKNRSYWRERLLYLAYTLFLVWPRRKFILAVGLMVAGSVESGW
jgi:hypothetical protein